MFTKCLIVSAFAVVLFYGLRPRGAVAGPEVPPALAGKLLRPPMRGNHRFKRPPPGKNSQSAHSMDQRRWVVRL